MKSLNFLPVFLSVAILFAGCQKTEHPNETTKELSEKKEIHFTKELQESSGLTTAKAERKKLISNIEVYGALSQDTENTVHIASKESGILGAYKVAVGDTVEEGASVASVETGSKEAVDVVSPSHGIVIAQYPKIGERVDAISSLITIANPDVMRASFDVYEKDLSFVSLGQMVKVKTTAYTDKEFTGKVVFISPRVDEGTRTIKIRVDVENKEHFLKFGMFVTGKIEKPAEAESVVVPLESVQGIEDKEVVFVRKAEEDFILHDVKVGNKTGDEAEILGGVAEGDEVVVRGSFILKSELLKDSLGEEE